MDFLCPDCAGDWPVVNAVMAHYQGKISVTLHTFPLPYHTFAFRAAQGAHAIAAINKTSPAEAVFQYAGMMFANQGDFYGADLTTTQVDAHIAELASTKLGYSSAAVAAGLADDNINEATRISWKHAVSRYSTGTPHCALSVWAFGPPLYHPPHTLPSLALLHPPGLTPLTLPLLPALAAAPRHDQ